MASGANPVAFWLGHLLFDVSMYMAIVAILFIIYASFQVSVLWTREVFIQINVLLLKNFNLLVIPDCLFTFALACHICPSRYARMLFGDLFDQVTNKSICCNFDCRHFLG